LAEDEGKQDTKNLIFTYCPVTQVLLKLHHHNVCHISAANLTGLSGNIKLKTYPLKAF
jgi:hypothetical protein